LAGANLPAIVGPTAVGKTAVALALAQYLPLEVISADSRQVYRRLDIGTAKPTARERSRLAHHGLDLINPGERYSAGRFAKDAHGWISAIRARDRQPVVVGGTGLYIKALVDGLFLEPPFDPARRGTLQRWTTALDARELLRWADRLDPKFAGGGRQRAARAIEVVLLTGRPLTWWQIAAHEESGVRPWYVHLTVPRAVLHQRISNRAQEMVRRGLIEEVAAVLSEGHDARASGLDGIGIREVVEYLHGRRPRDTVADAIAMNTRRYAKRQETWFRHQLSAPVLLLDATRSPEKLAAEIAAAWEERVQA
jgi:tRNA dimethylallyltransferase